MEHRVVLENINQCPVCANPLDAPEGESASGMGRTPAIGNNLLSTSILSNGGATLPAAFNPGDVAREGDHKQIDDAVW